MAARAKQRNETDLNHTISGGQCFPQLGSTIEKVKTQGTKEVRRFLGSALLSERKNGRHSTRQVKRAPQKHLFVNWDNAYFGREFQDFSHALGDPQENVPT